MSINTAADVFAHRLPILVKQVQARIARSHELWDLPGKCVRLLQILATYTPLEAPHLPLIFNRAKPAGLLDVSIRTIDRCLGILSERGLIVRVKQKRHGPGQWDCTSIRWTAVCVEKLFARKLTVPTINPMSALSQKEFQAKIIHASSQQPHVVPEQAVSMFDNSVKNAGTDENIAAVQAKLHSEIPFHEGNRTPDGATNLAHKTTPSSKEEVVKKPSGDGSPETNRQAELKRLMPRVPVDLIEPALSLELSRVQITTLMLRCREINQRLQDVFAVTKGTMDQQMLRNRDAMAWLLKVIGSGQDFRWLSKQKAQAKEDEQQLSRQLQFQADVIVALSKQPVALPNGVALSEVIADMAYIIDPSTRVITTSPVRQLARSLITQSPAWVKQLLRGQLPAYGDNLANPRPPISTFEPRPSIESDVVRSQIAELRKLLKQAG